MDKNIVDSSPLLDEDAWESAEAKAPTAPVAPPRRRPKPDLRHVKMFRIISVVLGTCGAISTLYFLYYGVFVLALSVAASGWIGYSLFNGLAVMAEDLATIKGMAWDINEEVMDINDAL